ncbi:MAG: hypothetical protein C0627_09015 [Sulfurimonas sp.]|nr:MAG: hypothetical protein C0627_09015 [Sulfurimonas sp.]
MKISKKSATLLSLALISIIAGCGGGEDDDNAATPQNNNTTSYAFAKAGVYQTGEQNFVATTSKTIINNEAAYIPSQCYTKKEDENGAILNPCYSCHTDAEEPNYIDDVELQTSYEFAEYALTNRWKNLF